MDRVHLQQLDNKLLDICSLKMKNRFLDRVMPVVSRLDDYGMIFIVLALVSIMIGYRANMAFYVLEALAVGLILGEGLLKHIFRRDRPHFPEDVQRLIKAPKTSSFPSGHTTSSFAVLFVLCYSESGLWYIFLLFATAIAFSRLYLYVHYPSDVLAGILLGLFSGYIIVMLSGNSHNDINMVKFFLNQYSKYVGIYF